VEVVGVYQVQGFPAPDRGSVRRPDDLDVRAFTQEDLASHVRTGRRRGWNGGWTRGKEVLTEELDPQPPGLSESRVVFFLRFCPSAGRC
jgi:hypothetical protein